MQGPATWSQTQLIVSQTRLPPQAWAGPAVAVKTGTAMTAATTKTFSFRNVLPLNPSF